MDFPDKGMNNSCDNCRSIKNNSGNNKSAVIIFYVYVEIFKNSVECS